MIDVQNPRSFRGKDVCVIGGTGLIGSQLVELLVEEGARVRIVSLDHPSLVNPKVKEFKQLDLIEPKNCLEACSGVEYVFSLFGLKGSPKMAVEQAATFFEKTLLISMQILRGARLAGVPGYLYTSSIGAYPPSEIFKEENVWSGPPSPNDEAAGYAKRMAEFHGKAHMKQYGWTDFTTVYPANVYGPRDNFDTDSATVSASLIKRALAALESNQPLIAWGDGSPVRDFIHAKDVACGMLLAAQRGPGRSYNVGSGVGVSIRELTDIIVGHLPKKVEVVWDTTQPGGDNKRIMDISRIRSLGFEQKISLSDGIRDTINWYLENRNETHKRYNPFNTV